MFDVQRKQSSQVIQHVVKKKVGKKDMSESTEVWPDSCIQMLE